MNTKKSLAKTSPKVENSLESQSALAFKKTTSTSGKGKKLEKLLKCPSCPKRFSRQGYLRMHQVTHNPQNRSLQCHQCDKKFCHPGHLALHLRTHDPENTVNNNNNSNFLASNKTHIIDEWKDEQILRVKQIKSDKSPIGERKFGKRKNFIPRKMIRIDASDWYGYVNSKFD